jgi:TolA-binding protein
VGQEGFCWLKLLGEQRMAKRRNIAIISGCIVSATLIASLRAQSEAVDLAQRSLQKAEGLASRGQHDLAKEEFDDFLKNFPKDANLPRAAYGRAVAEYNLNQLQPAAADLQTAIAQKDFSRRDEALALLATVQLALNDARSALATIDTLRTDHPASAQIEGALVNRAQALYRLGRYDESRAEAAAMLKVYPNSPHRAAALYVAALDQRAMNNDPAAETLAREISDKYPNAPYVWDARIMIGETLAGQGKNDAALAHFEKIAADAPAAVKPSIDFGRGISLSRAGKYEEARMAFETLVQKYPSSPLVPQAKLQSAVTLVRTNKLDQARAALAAVVEKNAALAPSATYYLARCDIQESQFEAARKRLEALIKSTQNFAEFSEARFDYIYTFVATGQASQAIFAIETFAKEFPQSPHIPEAIYYFAIGATQLGDIEKAIVTCDNVIAMGNTPMLRPAKLFKAELLVPTKPDDADAILAALEKDAAVNAEKIRITFNRARVSYAKADYKSTEERLAPIAAMNDDPYQQQAVFLLADVQLRQSKFADSVKSFQIFLAAGKDHTEEAKYKLALAQRGANDRKSAAATLAALVKGNPQDKWVQRGLFELGQIQYEERDTEKAAGAMEKLLALNPDEEIAAPAMLVAARIELDTGKPEAAARRLDALIQKYPASALAEDAAFTRGIALKDADKSKEAVEAFNSYIAKYPKGKFVTEAWHQGATSLTTSGKPADAVKILNQLADAKETRTDSVLYDLAWARRAAGEPKLAAAAYEALLAEYPKSQRLAAARVELADLYSLADRTEESVKLISAALKDPAIDRRTRAVALYRLGVSQLKLGQGKSAAASFDQFVSENPADPLTPSALCEAGAAWARAEEFTTAADRLKKVIADFPKSDAAKLAQIRIGDVQNSTGQYDAAAATFDQWIKDHPNDALTPLAEFGAGWSLENRALYTAARQRYQKVVGLDKGATAARAQFQIGETYFKEKQFVQAAKELLTVDILYSSPEWAAPALYEAGCALEALGDLPRAQTQWNDCIKKYPNSTVAQMARKKLETAAAKN